VKIVLDTNVYVSATLSKGNPYHVLNSAERGESDLHISPFILDEIEDVLSREKIPFEDEDVERFVDKILTIATVVTPYFFTIGSFQFPQNLLCSFGYSITRLDPIL
jgi:predicted nucleic acid-binding protein